MTTKRIKVKYTAYINSDVEKLAEDYVVNGEYTATVNVIEFDHEIEMIAYATKTTIDLLPKLEKGNKYMRVVTDASFI